MRIDDSFDIPVPDPFGDLDEWEDDLDARDDLVSESLCSSDQNDESDDDCESHPFGNEDYIDYDRIYDLRKREDSLDSLGMGYKDVQDSKIKSLELDVRRKKSESYLADHERKNNPDIFDRIEGAIKKR